MHGRLVDRPAAWVGSISPLINGKFRTPRDFIESQNLPILLVDSLRNGNGDQCPLEKIDLQATVTHRPPWCPVQNAITRGLRINSESQGSTPPIPGTQRSRMKSVKGVDKASHAGQESISFETRRETRDHYGELCSGQRARFVTRKAILYRDGRARCREILQVGCENMIRCGGNPNHSPLSDYSWETSFVATRKLAETPV